MDSKDYLVIPEGEGKFPAVILIHEIWGLVEHIKDVSRRISKEGYIVLAPDLLSGTGISEKWTPEILAQLSNPETREAAQPKMREITAPINSPEFSAKTVERLKGCFEFLKNHEKSTGKVAVVGFCFGGTYSFALAAAEPKLACAVTFYGHGPEEDERIKAIKCPILAFYGEEDTNLMSQLPFLKESMEKNHKGFEAVVYPNTGHAFFNDTNPNRYNKEAAGNSWNKMLGFLKEHLKG